MGSKPRGRKEIVTNEEMKAGKKDGTNGVNPRWSDM